MLRLCIFTIKTINWRNQLRFYRVLHNENRSIFYVNLQDDLKAVLRYKVNGMVLDMQGISVPSPYRGEGIARLLAEAAFTYALCNNYYMYLTCNYMQKYFLAVKNTDFEKRVVGPSNILDGPGSSALDPNIIYELPDPEDFM